MRDRHREQLKQAILHMLEHGSDWKECSFSGKFQALSDPRRRRRRSKLERSLFDVAEDGVADDPERYEESE